MPPKPVKHPVIFEDTDDPDYQKILTHITAARDKLNEVKRFDMPGFKPNEHYIREMKRYGVLPASFDIEKNDVNVYELDEYYWQHLWYYPEGKERPGYCPQKMATGNDCLASYKGRKKRH